MKSLDEMKMDNYVASLKPLQKALIELPGTMYESWLQLITVSFKVEFSVTPEQFESWPYAVHETFCDESLVKLQHVIRNRKNALKEIRERFK